MAYSAPTRWSHGDVVPAASMQKYSDGLTAIEPMISGQIRNWAVPASQFSDAQEFWLVHKARWLIYKSTGEIQPWVGTNPAVSLSSPDSINVFDIDAGVSWLVPGMLYRVVGCSVCFEDENGITVSGA